MLQFLDENFIPIGRRNDLLTLSWTTEYSGPGAFRALLPLTPLEENDPFSLADAHYVVNEDTGQTAAIDHIRRRFTADQGALADLTGRMLESILDRRVILEDVRYNDTAENIARALVDENAIQSEYLIPERAIPGLALGSTTGEIWSIPAEITRGQTLMAAITPILAGRGLTWRIRREGQRLWFDIWRGSDRTSTQSKNPVIRLDDRYGLAAEYAHDRRHFYTVAYAVSEHYQSVEREVDAPRRELYVPGPSASNYPSNAFYHPALQRAAAQALSEAAAPSALTVTIPPAAPLQPDRDFLLGDLVELSFPKIAAQGSLRLSALTRLSEKGVTTSLCTFTPDTLVEPEEI